MPFNKIKGMCLPIDLYLFLRACNVVQVRVAKCMHIGVYNYFFPINDCHACHYQWIIKLTMLAYIYF